MTIDPNAGEVAAIVLALCVLAWIVGRCVRYVSNRIFLDRD